MRELMTNPNPEALEEIKANLYSFDLALIEKAVRNVRLICCNCTEYQKIIQADIVPRLASLLESPFDGFNNIQVEAAWALTNIASSDDSKDADAVVEDMNASRQLIRLLRGSKSDDVRKQCAWALGNIAAHSVRSRDMVLNLGCLLDLVYVFDNQESDVTTIRITMWTLSNLFRSKPCLSDDYAKIALFYCAKLLSSDDLEIVSKACLTLSYISDGNENRIQMVIDAKVIPRLIELLSSDDYKLQSYAIRTIGNIITGNEYQTQAVINFGAVPLISSLLSHKEIRIQKEAFWTLSNIAAGSKSQITTVIDCKETVPRIIEALISAPYEIKKEACWVIANISSGGTSDQIWHITMAGAIPPLCTLITGSDTKIIQVALEGLENIVKASIDLSAANNTIHAAYVIDLIHTSGGYISLLDLRQHHSHSIYARAREMRRTIQDVKNDNIATFKILQWMKLMQELVVYHLIDCSSMIDLWQYMSNSLDKYYDDDDDEGENEINGEENVNDFNF